MTEARKIDRRSFLKGSAAATAALGALSLAGCAENAIKEDEQLAATGASAEDKAAAYAANEEGAEWIPVQCWHNCGARCSNKALVKDGVVLRQKTDDTHEDSFDWPQARGCIRGRSQRQKVFGPDRLKYPMKRKNWSPDNPNGHLRGIDEWERISWDEALDYVADELKKAKDKYGNQSIMLLRILPTSQGYMAPLLTAFGGFSDIAAVDSRGTFELNVPLFGLNTINSNDRYDMAYADYIVLYGNNAAWTSFACAPFLRYPYEKGAKFIFVGPEYGVTAAAMDAKWFPVRQGTDTAFLLGVAHAMLSNDVDGSIIDWDFLDRCTVGFDADHMPTDATTNENFRDYVMGVYDGIEKTPEWASEISGCPVELIEEYAGIMGKANNVSVFSSAGPARCRGSENFPQLLMTISAMGGHFGLPGNCVGLNQASNCFDNGKKLLKGGYDGRWFNKTPVYLENPVDNYIPSQETWSAVLDGHFTDSGHVLKEFREAQQKECDIHVIISEMNNKLQTTEGLTKGVEAFRKVDFVLSSAYWLKTDALYADIVLPVCTRWEINKYGRYMNSCNRDRTFAYKKVTEPLFESRSDHEIGMALAERLGLEMDDDFKMEEEQGWFNTFAAIQIIDDAGEDYKPFLTITQEDIDRYGVEGTPQEGVLDFEEFFSQGLYTYKRSEGDVGANVSYAGFRANPDEKPLETASGKLEIYCQAKADYLDMANKFNEHYTPVSPLPKLLPTLEGYIESFEDWDAKKKGKYPYQVSNSHYLRRAHTEQDNVPWVREAMTHPIFISKEDADAKGIKSGDPVLVWNDNGKILRPASVSRCIMPGTLELPHGAAAQIDEETGIDVAGSDNTLCSPNLATCTQSNGWNSTLVDFELYTGDLELLPDCEWAPRVPIAE